MKSLVASCLALVLIAGLCPLRLDAAEADDRDKFVATHANAGMKAHERGDLDSALTLYTKVIDSGFLKSGEPLLAYLHNNRGVIWLEKGDEAKAFSDFSKSIENGSESTAFFNRGNIWSDRGEYEKAIADYSQAISLRPDYAKSYYKRGLAWKKLGDQEQAEADFGQAARLDPEYKAP